MATHQGCGIPVPSRTLTPASIQRPFRPRQDSNHLGEPHGRGNPGVARDLWSKVARNPVLSMVCDYSVAARVRGTCQSHRTFCTFTALAEKVALSVEQTWRFGSLCRRSLKLLANCSIPEVVLCAQLFLHKEEVRKSKAFAAEQAAVMGWHQLVWAMPWHFRLAPVEVRSQRELILWAVRADPEALSYATAVGQARRAVVLAAVSHDGRVLQHVSKQERNDPNVVLAAVQQNREALRWASEALKQDKAFVMRAVQQTLEALPWALSSMQRKEEVAMAAVQQDGLALQFVHNDMKRHKKVVMSAVQQNGLALRFAPDSMKCNKEVVMAAVQHNGLALQFAPDFIKDNKQVVMAAVQQNVLALRFASWRLKGNTDVVAVAACFSQDRHQPDTARDALLAHLPGSYGDIYVMDRFG